MADSQSLRIIDHFKISPPPASVPTTSLPLSFFDIPWFLCRPIQRLIFFQYLHPTSYFIDNVLPNLKHSLSLTLQHFFPLAANLNYPSPPHKPFILFNDGDSIPFTLAESTADFNQVISNHPKDVTELHPYVPKLPSSHLAPDGTRVVPLLALQITLFPNSGISIGFEFCHVVADGMAFNHFIKSWASVYKSKGDLNCLDKSLLPYIWQKKKKSLLPYHVREAIKDPSDLESIFLKELKNWAASWDYDMGSSIQELLADKVRATFVIDQPHIQKLKDWITNSVIGLLQASTFVVTCAFIWVNLIKSQEENDSDLVNNDKPCYLGFVADCRHRLEDKLPITYFGNCLAVCYAPVKRSELLGENGIVIAAKAIAKVVKELENGVLKGAEKWMSDWKEISEQGNLITISGSPKLRVYETDFGWGRPKKTEVVQIDVSSAVSLSECRDGRGGVEVGLALTRTKMDVFNALFQQHLNRI